MDEFKYILELEGKDYARHEGKNGDQVTFVLFKETNFFMSIEEAMDALVAKNVRSFEEMSQDDTGSKYHEIASLRSAENDELLLQVFRISFNDSPEGAPTAGIYFSFEDRSAEEFEKFTGFDLTGFGDYDPEAPFLLLGSYSYDPYSGFKIAVDQGITDWEHRLQYYGQDQNFYDDEWKYKIEIVEDAFDEQLSHQITCYHFHELPEAARFFLKSDINRLDKDLAEGLEEKSWISEAHLKERGERPIVDLIAVKNTATDEKTSEPGIHLNFFVPIEDFEKCVNIDLSGLGNYGQDDTYLLLANYLVEPGCDSNDYQHYQELSPCPGYTGLLININKEKPQVHQQEQQQPFLIRVTWEKTDLTNNEVNDLSMPMVRETPCASIDEGLAALSRLNTIFFDKDTAVELQYPLFIKHADLIERRKVISNREIKPPGTRGPKI